MALAVAASLGGCSTLPMAQGYCGDNETREALRKLSPSARLSVAVRAGCLVLGDGEKAEVHEGGEVETGDK
ncbi:hypothetical protein [Pseudoteredinibacter isoporae]|uniref:hypothetical protein n=1 Tax=Pseudoteredinibacter isoporae TaxID=570281 RepID=UPI0031099418